ncbi:MAG: acetate kinase [Candidatus Hydrogenedentes bacterium]|nr:acetate kinase [Candidatus Hydrogenedentota bacterium]
MPTCNKVLVLNSGSSSVKFKLFEVTDKPRVLAKGSAERIGQPGFSVKCECTREGGKSCQLAHPSDYTAETDTGHAAAINLVCSHLLSHPCNIVEDISEIVGVGHRVVHGGERFTGSVIIDSDVIDGIQACARLAPLHNPPALMGIRACASIFPEVPQVAVFDTAFHHTIPEKAFLYGIPREFHQKYGIRKYGFHGLSHQYVALEAAKHLGKPITELKLITCHLGNGSSITAVEYGRSIDTSMGLTPLGGIMMGTRPGDLDPYIPIFMLKELGMSVEEVEATLNRGSGMEGISGYTDMRDVEAHMVAGDPDCSLALEMFAYRAARRMGSYVTVMNGADAMVFTGGIGENDPFMRARILATFTHLGLFVDAEKNICNARCVTTPASKVAALVIPTNEELVIARETYRLVQDRVASAQAAAAD